MSILYLDQNAWIALAQAIKERERYPEAYAVVEELVRHRKNGSLQVPLSFTNIYETHKINDPVRRRFLSWVMCTLSQGKVFRGRTTVLRQQLVDFLLESHGKSKLQRQDNWFLSDLHFECLADYTPKIFGPISDRILERFRANPAASLFDYLNQDDEETRKQAIVRMTAGLRKFLTKLEMRRAQIRAEAPPMRKRIYAAQLLLEHMDLVLELAKELKLPTDLGSSRARAMMEAVPVFHIERELQLRTEAEDRDLEENDLRDMQSFYTVLPYADIFVAEKPFINRARQAGLGKRYATRLLTSVLEIPKTLDGG